MRFFALDSLDSSTGDFMSSSSWRARAGIRMNE